MSTKVLKASDHSSYNMLMVVTFLIPFVGFIMGLVYLAKNEELEHKVGMHLIIASILFFIFWVIIFSAIASTSTTSFTY